VPFTQRRLEGDYAVMVPSPGAYDGELRQVLSLRWRFEVQRTFDAKIRSQLKDKRGRIYLARIALAPGPPDAQDWTLELKDRKGKVVKTLRGAGLVPSSVVWDGKDDAGQPVEASGVNYVLRATHGSGIVIEHKGLLAPSADLGLDDTLAGPDRGDFSTRSAALASVVKPKVRLKGAGELAVSSADFDLSGLSGVAKASSWEVRIVDTAGRTVRTIAGKGRPPKSVRWEGTDDLGKAVEGSLGASFEVRVTSAGGIERLAASAPVVPERGFADLAETARKRPVLPTPSCGRDPQTHELLCTFYFERFLAELTDEDLQAVANAAAIAQTRGLKTARIDGHADHEGSRERTDELSQERADAVLKALVERGLVLEEATAKGWADMRPADDGDSSEAYDRNRRVELRFIEPAH
jgi:OOP family OmpA-OmpF porin